MTGSILRVRHLAVLAGQVAVFAGLLAVHPLAAQEPLLSLYDKLQVNLSLTGVFLNSDIRVDGSEGGGTEVDAEDDLGLDKLKLEPRAAVRYRPWRRHEFEAGYQFARRTGEKTLERTIEVGDSTFDLGARVKTIFDSDQAFLTYRFAIMAKERTQLGAGLGLGALFFKFGVEAQLDAGGGSAEGKVEKSITAPVGSLGVYGRFLSGDRWQFDADARVFALEIDRFDITVLELGGAARYALSQKFSLELGYSGSGITVDVLPKDGGTEESRLEAGKVKYSLQSLRFGATWVP
ncbi:MAG TPA: hypothetical protein VLA95_02650 [Gemmatimonadales bacterium]|nr:hypothetical protein [Gemmatimonadales bacterium]